jgi:SET domain-containing protein
MPTFATAPTSVSEENSTRAIQDDMLYEIEHIENKGRGLKSAKPITQGTRILAELPLITVSELKSNKLSDSVDEIQAKLDEASLEVVGTIMGLHNAHVDTEPELVGIVHTNAFHLDEGRLGVFGDASYINHSCRPNVEAEWDPNLGMLMVHANQDIKEGEE